MIKYLIVFVLGIIETYLFTWWNLSANKHQYILSSILMFVYMFIYLGIISFAIKDVDTVPMILTYAVSCAIGNFLRLKHETNKKLS